MKRLVWLLILVFGTALAQVSPVDLGIQNQKSCSCCEIPGACGVPDCNLPPSSGPATLVASQPAPAVSLAARRNAIRAYLIAVKFLLSPKAGSVAFNSSERTTAVGTQVPLFKVNCSFLI